MTSDDALEVAHRIAVRLTQQAEWAQDQCSWTVTIAAPPVDSSPLLPLRATAEGHLYAGTSGIGLFLLEAWRLTGDARLLKVAEGAFSRAAHLGREMPRSSAGFHSGRSGIGYALARAAKITNSDRWETEARSIVDPLLRDERLDAPFDVISGIAGGVIALAEIATVLESSELRHATVSLADRLFASARHGADGWSWDGGGLMFARDLTGYGHGAAGGAHALVEVYRMTGDLKYRFAAEQAFAYERSAFDPAIGNWLDYRDYDVTLAMRDGQEGLRRWVLDGRIPAHFVPTSMTAWCHGAGGIGLTRLHAYRTFGDTKYRDEAIVAVRRIESGLINIVNYSLCHGAMGNCETLLFAREVLDDLGAEQLVLEVAARASEAFELRNRPWPSGAINRVPDPSLMMGDAGIGYFYLRLANKTVPSVLLPVVSVPRCKEIDGSDEHVRADYRREYFPLTLNLLERDGVKSWLSASGGEAELATLVPQLEARIASAPRNEAGDQLRECFHLERTRYALALKHTYRSDELVLDITRISVSSIDWSSIRIGLQPELVCITTRWDWPEKTSLDSTVPEGQRVHLIQSRDGFATIRPLSAFSSLVLESLEPPCRLCDVFDRVGRHIDENDLHNEVWKDAVLAQLKSAYSAGLLSVSTDAA